MAKVGLPSTPVGRVSFPTVFVAEAFEEGKQKKYGLTLIFDEDTDLREIKKAVKKCVKDKFGDKPPAKYNLPWRDNEEKSHIDGYENAGCFIHMTSKFRPKVVDAGRVEIDEESDRFYGGCYARASYTVYWYDFKGNKGVALGLGNVQKLQDGERFGSSSNVDDDFDVVEGYEGKELEAAESVY